MGVHIISDIDQLNVEAPSRTIHTKGIYLDASQVKIINKMCFFIFLKWSSAGALIPQLSELETQLLLHDRRWWWCLSVFLPFFFINDLNHLPPLLQVFTRLGIRRLQVRKYADLIVCHVRFNVRLWEKDTNVIQIWCSGVLHQDSKIYYGRDD